MYVLSVVGRLIWWWGAIRSVLVAIWKGAGIDAGGDDRIRTGDLCVANAALSQLSYVPNLDVKRSLLVAAVGLEPTTFRL